jgi:hypothetical protein
VCVCVCVGRWALLETEVHEKFDCDIGRCGMELVIFLAVLDTWVS